MKNKLKTRIISGIITSTILMSNIVPAYATIWEVEGDEVLLGTERTATVTYNPTASFMVSVPKTIILDTKTKSADYEITVKGVIEDGTEVVVAPKDSITDIDGVNFYMSDESIYKKNDVVANVTQKSTEWLASEVTESGTTKKGSISAQDLSYGDWSGNLIFMINLCEDHEHNYKNGICTECGKTDPSHEHNYTEKVTKEPTCTEEGEKTLTCDCGDTKTESIPATGHNFEDGTCTNCGEKDPNHEHNYTEKVTKEPTCTEEGEKTLTCVCGDTKTETIPALGHNFKDGTCTNCGEKDPNHEHEYTIETVIKEPTCTEEGEKKIECVCGDFITETIPVIDHDYNNGTCTMCGKKCTNHEYELASEWSGTKSIESLNFNATDKAAYIYDATNRTTVTGTSTSTNSRLNSVSNGEDRYIFPAQKSGCVYVTFTLDHPGELEILFWNGTSGEQKYTATQGVSYWLGSDGGRELRGSLSGGSITFVSNSSNQVKFRLLASNIQNRINSFFFTAVPHYYKCKHCGQYKPASEY